MTRHRRSMTAVLASVLVALVAGCGGGGNGTAGTGSSAAAGGNQLAGATFSVGSKEFTESIVLAQITIQALENAGAKVEAKTGISGSATVRQALQSKQIDMYWEYTGTGWVNILGNTTRNVPTDLYQAVSTADKKNSIAWLPPAPLNDTYRLAVAKDFAKANNLTTTTQAADFIKSNAGAATVCAASEFINRDDGLAGLQTAYGFKFSNVVQLDLGLVYTQIGKTCNFGEVFSTDARIVANNLAVLDDDKNFFVEYKAALTMRQETLDQHPAVAQVMAPISAALTDDAIIGLNAKVDVDGEEPADVAKDWLTERGFVRG